MTDTDLSTWLPTVPAAAAIGCSPRTLERRAPEWHIEKRLRPQAGSPAVAVYNPDDVARIAAERRPAAQAFVLPPAQTAAHGNGHGRSADLAKLHSGHAPSGDDPIRQLAVAFRAFLLSPPSPPVAETLAETLWVTVAEASAITGLSQAWLRRRIADGALSAIRDRGWRIRRTDLEAL